MDHLAADEAAGDVGVDRLGRVESRLALAERPRARLLVAGSEERDEVERVAAASRRSRRAPTARRRGTRPPPRRRAAASSSSSSRSIPSGPVHPTVTTRLRRQRVELGRQRLAVVRDRAARLDVGEQLLELDDLLAQLRVARLRLLAARARAGARRGRGRRRAARAGAPRPRRSERDDHQQRVDLAQVAEQLRAGARDVDDADRRRRDLARLLDRGQLRQPLVGDRRHADVLLQIVRGDTRLRERVEERGLPRARRADDSHLESHREEASRTASASAARRARGAGAT